MVPVTDDGLNFFGAACYVETAKIARLRGRLGSWVIVGCGWLQQISKAKLLLLKWAKQG